MSVDTIKAPKSETDEKGHHEHGIVATLCDTSHFHLVFDERLDADMQPELDDFSLVVEDKRVDLAGLRLTSGVRKGGAWSLISFSLKTKGAIKPGSTVQITYHPRQFFLWSEDRDEPIEGFELQATASEGSGLNSMDLRSKDGSGAGEGDKSRRKALARIVEASERQIRISLKHELDTRLSPHVEDFRAECNARRLTIDRVYLSRASSATELSLFLRELVEPEGKVKVSYKSGKASLRTVEGELLDGFRIEALAESDEDENEQNLAALADVDHLLALAQLSDEEEQAEESSSIASNKVVQLFSGAKEEETKEQEIDEAVQEIESGIAESPIPESNENAESQITEEKAAEAASAEIAVPQQETKPEIAPAPRMPILRKPVTRLETSERVLPQQVVAATAQEQTEAGDGSATAEVDPEGEAQELIVEAAPPKPSIAQRLKNLSVVDVFSLSVGAFVIGWGLFALVHFGSLIFSFSPDEEAKPNLIQQLTSLEAPPQEAQVEEAQATEAPAEESQAQEAQPEEAQPEEAQVATQEAAPQVPDQRESCERTYDDGSRYNGSCLHGARDGGGSFTFANGDIYNGEWKDDQFHGNGMMQKANGEIYAGGFQNGNMHGKGSYRWPDGKIYEGEFQNGEFHGQGTLTEADGRRFEGRFENGSEVEGVCHRPDGIKISGSCDVPD